MGNDISVNVTARENTSLLADPNQGFASLQEHTEQLNLLASKNQRWLKVNFGIEQVELNLHLSKKNLLPECTQKELYKWCGSGVMIDLKFTKAGLPVTRHYKEAMDFVKQCAPVCEATGFLASLNREYRSFVQAVRN